MLPATATPNEFDDEAVRAELRRKLAWMIRVREGAAQGLPPDRADLQALAAAFPGALRELDDTPMDALRARTRELDDAQATLPPWALATWRYHAALRRDLDATRRGERPRGALVDRAIAEVARSLGLEPRDAEMLVMPYARRRWRTR